MKTVLGFLLALTASASALYSASDDVVELTTANFDKLVKQGDELWLVEFYAPWCGHCKNLAPEWKKAATALKGVVKVGAVDMDQHQSLGGPYNVRGFPTIKVFGANKNSPTDYNGQRTAQSIVDTALSTASQMAKDRLSGKSGSGKKSGSSSGGSGGGSKPGNQDDVVELTDSNFEELVLQSEDLWLVEFFAPWCGHCKNLAPQWASAATQLKGKVKLGALDATVHTVMASRYGIEMFPTILLFSYNKLDDLILYQGGHSDEELVLFAMEHYTEFLNPPDIREIRGYPSIKVFAQGKKDGEAQDYEGGRTSSDIVTYALDRYSENVEPPEIVQLTGQGVLEAACNDHQLCVIAVLPHILDCQAECRNKYIEILRQMGDKYKKRQWGWVWAEAGAQMAVEDAFGIGGFGYPAMAAMNSRKMKFALLKGSFSETGINEFLRELAVGRGSTAPVKNAELPKVVDSDGWDGKDGEMPMEEDIDLSDVELDDIDLVKNEL